MDTLKCTLNLSDTKKVINALSELSNYTTIISSDGRMVWSAMYKNMKCIYNGIQLTIIGSISKFIHGTNQHSVNKKDIENAISELSVMFKTDIGSACIRRIDYAENIIMNYEVGKYISLLQPGNTGKPFLVGNETFDVVKSGMRVSAYDKIKELKKSKVPIIPELTGKNVLRWELRLFKNIAPKFNVPSLTLSMLKEQWVFDRLKELWATEILKTNIKHSYIPNINCSNTSSFISSLASHGIEALGIEIILQEIDSKDWLTANQKCRLLKKLKYVNIQNASSTSKLLADELYDKVRFIANVSVTGFKL